MTVIIADIPALERNKELILLAAEGIARKQVFTFGTLAELLALAKQWRLAEGNRLDAAVGKRLQKHERQWGVLR
jgi:hypothetical protein